MTKLWYRHADYSFWRSPPPDAHTPIADADLDKVQKALDRGHLPRLEGKAWKIYTPDDPPSDVLLYHVRQDRNLLLTQTDWTQIPDVVLTPQQKKAWSDYRTKLRDLPQNYPDGKNVKWPDKPK